MHVTAALTQQPKSGVRLSQNPSVTKKEVSGTFCSRLYYVDSGTMSPPCHAARREFFLREPFFVGPFFVGLPSGQPCGRLLPRMADPADKASSG